MKYFNRETIVTDKIDECLRYGEHFAEFGPEFSARLYATRARKIFTTEGTIISEQNLTEYLRLNEQISHLEQKVYLD